MRLLSIDWWWEIMILLLFWRKKNHISGGKIGVAGTLAPKGPGLKDATNNCHLPLNYMSRNTQVSLENNESYPSPYEALASQHSHANPQYWYKNILIYIACFQYLSNCEVYPAERSAFLKKRGGVTPENFENMISK